MSKKLVFSKYLVKKSTSRTDYVIPHEKYNSGVIWILDKSKETGKYFLNPEDNIEIVTCLLSSLIYQYSFASILKTVTTNWGIEQDDYIIKVKDYNLIYGIFKFKGIVVVVFKGSSDFQDFLIDSDIIQVNDSYGLPGKIHKGFHDLLFDDENYLDVMSDLRKIRTTEKIFITGHSLGAALASLFYAYVDSPSHNQNTGSNSRLNNCFLYTFGCPRVGNYKFSSSIKGKRIVNGNDIVASIPLPPFYYHSDKIKKIGAFRFLGMNVKDHYISNYYNALTQERETSGFFSLLKIKK